MRLLRITLLAGLMLIFLSGTALTVFILTERSGFRASRQQDSFSRLLREYDIAAERITGTEREIDSLHRELNSLEKRAITVESWLSILKRRRALLSFHPSSIVNYRNSINNALKIFPHSQPINAIASAALVKDSGINMEAEEQLRQWLSDITDSNFNSLRLSLHVLLGDFRNPQKAALLPENLVSDGTEAVTVNLAILKILRGNYQPAAADIQMLLNSSSPSFDILRFAAEYHYDFGDLLRSAEIFSYINDSKAMIRQADALFLAGFPETAAAIWSELAYMNNENSLYNLAFTAKDRQEAAAYFEKLVNLDSDSKARQFGLIRYSRLLDYPEAVSLLLGNSLQGRNTISFSPSSYPYIDLEIIKRHAQGLGIGRQLAETWLLLDRHDGNEELYKWAFWLFFFQQNLDEAGILMDRMRLQQIKTPWLDVYRAIYLMVEGNIDEAENILRSMQGIDTPWYVYANIGRILEAVRSHARALEQYQTASQVLLETSQVQNPKTEARLQIHIARCLIALNRPREARAAYQYALELDPENLTARLELDRFF